MAASDVQRIGDAGARKRVRWPRILAVLVALALLVEATAQLVVLGFAGAPFRSLSLYRWSAYGLVRNNPDLTSPDFIINRNGFRALSDYQRKKPKNTFRVLLLGGSVLYSGLGGPARLWKYGRVHSSQTVAPYLEEILRKDPAFAGVKVEVINASVNFNRIVEISSAYLEEYLHWEPDFIVVFGGVNNFSAVRATGDLAAGRTELQRPHPWRLEFERLVNDHGLAALLERAWRTGAEHSAALALGRKIAEWIADRLATFALMPLARLQDRRTALPETAEERKAYMRLYASYAEAMVAAARRAGQGIAFVWEPMLSDLEGVKPLSEEEKTIFPAVKRNPDAIAQYEATRREFNSLFAEIGTPAVDPTEALRKNAETVFIDYAHYTPDGNRFIAGVVRDELRAAMVAQLARRTFTSVGQ